jgi:YVTN family beta-propeller protein
MTITKLALLLLASILPAYIVTAQEVYTHDRVYAANQISNTVSVIDPSQHKLLGEIRLGKSYTNVLSPLYKGQALVHGLRYSAEKKMLAVVSIGSNSLTLLSTETNQVLKTIYLGRSPHEPTFTPDSRQVWVSVRGEAYVSVIDVEKMVEVKRVPVADGPGMISFSPDGKLAYVCSSFTAELDVVNTTTYEVVKKIAVVSPFSPNIMTSPKGEWIAMTHKDVGKVTVINAASQSVAKILNTGLITNHVSFTTVNNKLLMLVTVGGENKVKVFDVADDFRQTDSISVGPLPHGLWPSADGKLLYAGLEYSDQVQAINLETMKVLTTIKIGQSPQALVYADHAVTDAKNVVGLSGLNDTAATDIIKLEIPEQGGKAAGRLAVRPIGLADLVEQTFSGLQPGTAYTLALSRSKSAPYKADNEINSFTSDALGKYSGQSTGLVKSVNRSRNAPAYAHVMLINNQTRQIVLINSK